MGHNSAFDSLILLNFALEKGALHRDQTTALITLLLKKVRIPLNALVTGQFSLLSTDSKLLAKLLALRLDRCIGDLITYDQSGFLRERFSADNIRRLLHIINKQTPTQLPLQSFLWMQRKHSTELSGAFCGLS